MVCSAKTRFLTKSVRAVFFPGWLIYENKGKTCMSFQRVGTSNDMIRACGFGELWHRLNIDRLVMLLRCLDSRRAVLRDAARAMLHAELR